jgi:Acetyltransferase (GNAT) domain
MLGGSVIFVSRLQEDLEECYRAFIDERPEATIYTSLEWRNFLRAVVPGNPWYLIARENGAISGVLPLFASRDVRGGRLINSLPWYGSHGACCVATEAARLALLRELRALIGETRPLSTTVILTPVEQKWLETYRRALDPRASDLRIGQVTTLPSDGPELERRLESVYSQKTRNLVRKSLKQGFACQVRDDEEAWDFLHRTHDDNMRAVGRKAKPRAHFSALRSHLPGRMRKLYIASREGVPVAALLLAFHKRTVEYLTPVVKVEQRPKQPLSFLIHLAMLDAIRAGFDSWNWGGTWINQESLHHFKKGWGATDHPYSYLVCADASGVDRLRTERECLGELFPYFYAYPYASLG